MAGFRSVCKLEHSVGAPASNTSMAVVVLWCMNSMAINELTLSSETL